MKLSKCAEVKSGLVLSRKKSSKTKEYRYNCLNLKAVNSQGYIEKESLDTFYAQEVLSEDYLTKSGDIIVRLTHPYTAILIDDNTKGILISSNFIKIETDLNKLIPEYLEWCLNTESIKRDINKHTSAFTIKTINPGYYKDFNIKLVDLDRQKKIAEVSKMMKKEQYLLKQLTDKKELLNKALINKILEK